MGMTLQVFRVTLLLVLSGSQPASQEAVSLLGETFIPRADLRRGARTLEENLENAEIVSA